MTRTVKGWKFMYSTSDGCSKYSGELECGHTHTETTYNEEDLPDSVWCYKCEPRRKLIVSG